MLKCREKQQEFSIKVHAFIFKEKTISNISFKISVKN